MLWGSVSGALNTGARKGDTGVSGSEQPTVAAGGSDDGASGAAAGTAGTGGVYRRQLETVQRLLPATWWRLRTDLASVGDIAAYCDAEMSPVGGAVELALVLLRARWKQPVHLLLAGIKVSLTVTQGWSGDINDTVDGDIISMEDG